MTILLDHILLALAAAVLGRPLLRRPLSEDDGNWYYYAWFRERGVRLYREIPSAYGYFGIFGTAALLFRLFRAQTPLFFNVFKAVWYFFNALSVYWLTLLWSSNHGMALLAALILTLVMTVPNTLFFLTYAEHFMILPLSLALVCLHLGLAGAGLSFFLFMGLCAAWAMQIKPTALIFAAALLPLCSAAASPGHAGALYLSALAGVTLLPCYLLRRDARAWRGYLRQTFGGAIGLLAITLDRVSGRFSRWLVPESLRSGQAFAYLQGHHQMTLQQQGAAFWRFMGPSLGDLRAVALLALLQGIFPGRFDALTLAMFALAGICLLMQQIQKNYYTPHFNTIWMPLSVLAAKTLWEAAAAALQGGIAGGIVLLLALFECPRIAKAVRPAFGREARERAGFLGPLLGALFCLGEGIGAYIRKHSQPDEKLLVWGDQPSIYLYADRQCFDPDYLFMYTHMRRIHDEAEQALFVDRFRRSPPEWVLFYQYKFADGWTMARLEATTGVPYQPVTQFRLADRTGGVIRVEGGIELVFPLYRRDDDRYRAILTERAAFALLASDREAYRAHLDRIADLYPQDPEAGIRREALERYGASVEGLRAYLESRRNRPDPAMAPLVAVMLGDLHRRAGQLDQAARRYEEASRGIPHDFRVFNGLSEIAYSRGDVGGALRLLEKAYQINPYSAEISNNLGALYSLAGNREKAGLFFKKALDMIPGYRDAIDNLEQLYPGSSASGKPLNLGMDGA